MGGRGRFHPQVILPATRCVEWEGARGSEPRLRGSARALAGPGSPLVPGTHAASRLVRRATA